MQELNKNVDTLQQLSHIIKEAYSVISSLFSAHYDAVELNLNYRTNTNLFHDQWLISYPNKSSSLSPSTLLGLLSGFPLEVFRSPPLDGGACSPVPTGE